MVLGRCHGNTRRPAVDEDPAGQRGEGGEKSGGVGVGALLTLARPLDLLLVGEEGATVLGLDTARFTGTPARYVRVHGVERGTEWGYSLHEVGVHSG